MVDSPCKRSLQGIKSQIRSNIVIPYWETNWANHQPQFPTSNNEAEYEAILIGLNLALTFSTTKVEVKSDSQLVVGQI